MDPEEEFLKEYPLNDPKPSIHQYLLASLNARNYAAFQSFLNRGLRKHPPSVILNYVYPSPDEKTLLEIACSKGLTEFVQLLLNHLEHPNHINRINENFGRGLLHFAVEEGHLDVLQVLLQNPFINPNLEVGMQTALHMAVRNEDLRCIEVLLNAGARPDIPNAKGTTVLHQAGSSKNKEIIDLIFRTSRNYTVPLDIDTFKDYKKQTVRNILQANFPEMSLPEKQARKVDFNFLKYFLIANDETNFLKNLAEVDPDEPINVRELIIVAAGQNLLKAVVALLSKREKVDLLEPAEIALQRGHFEVFREILKCDFSLGQKLIIKACEELTMPVKLPFGHESNRLKFVKLIMSSKNIDVTIEDEKGNTALHYAARAENDEVVEELLQAGSYIGHMNRFDEPPLAHIRPKIIKAYLDKHITSSKEHSEDFEIDYDYNCLIPHSSRPHAIKQFSKSKKSIFAKAITEIQAVYYIAQNQTLLHLLKHPILASFLYIKWSRIRHIYYANVLCYLLFFSTFVAFIIITNSKSEDDKSDIFKAREKVMIVCIFLQLIVLAMREFFQFLPSPSHYIVRLENYFEVPIIILVGVYLFTTNPQVGAIVVLLSAWKLVELIGQHPKMSTQIETFKKVLVNFIYFFLLYAFLIFAFALAFYMIFGGTKKFPNASMSIFKTILMLIGEFETSDMPFEMDPILGRIIFLAFIFIIAIVLFNLLTGIAVSDTQNIQTNAELVTLVARTKKIFRAEEIAMSVPDFAENSFCSCLQPAVQNLNLNFARRVLLFPKYLPEGKLSEKPYQNHEILIQGRVLKPSWFTTLKMDPSISDNARDIVFQRRQISLEETMPSELDALNKRWYKLKSIFVNSSEMDAVNKRLDKIELNFVRLSEMVPVNERLDKFESILMNLIEVSKKTDHADEIELNDGEQIQNEDDNTLENS